MQGQANLCEFKPSQGYIVRSCQKKRRWGRRRSGEEKQEEEEEQGKEEEEEEEEHLLGWVRWLSGQSHPLPSLTSCVRSPTPTGGKFDSCKLSSDLRIYAQTHI